MIDQKKVRKCEGDVLLSDFKRKKEERESTAGRNKNHEGLTTSVHSHSSMSSMTEDCDTGIYGAKPWTNQSHTTERHPTRTTTKRKIVIKTNTQK